MGIRDKKTEEEKARERAAIQDSMQTGGIEQQAINQKQQEKKGNSNQLFDVESARQMIKEGLLGKKTKPVQVQNPETKEIQVKQYVEYSRKDSLCNEEGAYKFLDEANSFLNKNTISTYLPASTIENKGKGTLKEVYKQIIVNWHIYDINPEDAGDIISIIRNPMIDAMNKARGGRLIKNQEQIRVEKESISREGSSESDDNDSRFNLF